MAHIIFALSAIIILLATVENKMPSGIIGAIGVMVVVGYILNVIGDKTPSSINFWWWCDCDYLRFFLFVSQ